MEATAAFAISTLSHSLTLFLSHTAHMHMYMLHTCQVMTHVWTPKVRTNLKNLYTPPRGTFTSGALLVPRADAKL